MATGIKKKPTKGGLYQAYFTDYTGKRRYFTALTRTEAKREAKRLDAEHRLIRQGIRPVPTSTDKHRVTPLSEVIEEYLAWGESQGGRQGRPWSEVHAHNRRTQLSWWRDRLGLEMMADLGDILNRVEKELRQVQSLGRTGKTISSYAESLGAFCEWCVQRGFLKEDPLKALAPFDTTPQDQRRAMTPDEIMRLLSVCPPYRRLLYETAFLSGLRVKELRHLTLDHLDSEHAGLVLDGQWTKNKKPGFQPLPRVLVERLRSFAESGEPAQLYAENFRRGSSKDPGPTSPLLYVPSHPSRTFDQDLKAADIPKRAPGGKLDFHACRTAYVNLVFEFGMVSPKEAQDLARHSTPDLTFNVYGRSAYFGANLPVVSVENYH